MEGAGTGPLDSELVSAARAGSHRSFELLVERHFAMVFAIAYANLGHAETAEDLTQEVFLRAHLYLDSLADANRFAAWLSRIARNLARDWQRRGQRASRLLAMVPIGDLPRELPDAKQRGAREMMADGEEARAVHEAIMGLPPDQREIVFLHFMEDMSQAEIARRLEVNDSTVSRQIDRALNSMRKSLAPLVRDSLKTLRQGTVGRNASLTARTLALVAAASALSVQSKAALAASAGGKAWADAVALRPPMASPPTGFLGLLKTISVASGLAAGKGGVVMMTSKGVAVAVVVGALAVGGVVYHLQAEKAKTMTKKTGAGTVNAAGGQNLTPEQEKLVGVANRLFPSEVRNVLLAFQVQSGPVAGMQARFVDADLKTWVGSPMLLSLPAQQHGSLQLGLMGPTRKAAVVIDEEGVAYPLTYGAPQDMGGGKPAPMPISIDVQKPWPKGASKRLLLFTGGETLKQSGGSYPFTLQNTRISPGVQQFALVIPKGIRIASTSEQPASTQKAGEVEVNLWRKQVAYNEEYRVDVVLERVAE